MCLEGVRVPRTSDETAKCGYKLFSCRATLSHGYGWGRLGLRRIWMSERDSKMLHLGPKSFDVILILFFSDFKNLKITFDCLEEMSGNSSQDDFIQKESEKES